VERSQRTDLEEFYPTVDLKHPELKKKLQDWHDYYNEFRPHGSFNGKTPLEKWGDLSCKLHITMKLKPPLTNQKNGFDCKITGMIYTGKN
jgi:hypothetical protein